MGLWFEQISHPMDHLCRVFETHNAEYVLDDFVVSVWNTLLQLWKNFQKMD